MKHSLSILVPFCVVGLVIISVTALDRNGMVIFQFKDGGILIDGR